jgi:hypothetical protein
MAKKPSRKQRAVRAQKPTTAPKKVQQPVQKTEAQRHRLPNVIRLVRTALSIIWRHKKSFAGITGIYIALSLFFVGFIGSGLDVAAIRDGFGSRLIGGGVAYVQLLAGGTSSESGSVYQLVLFIIASLVVIWALRQAHAGQSFGIREAYYKGLYPIAPCIVIIFVMILQLLPMIFGLTIYQLVVANGIAAGAIENIIWAILLLATMLTSLFFITSSLQAFYIATLPDMTPWPALKAARKLVKGRRWTVARKVLFLPLLLLIATGLLLLPVIIVAPAIAPFALQIIGPILIVVSHSYLYGLYRELMHD